MHLLCTVFVNMLSDISISFFSNNSLSLCDLSFHKLFTEQFFTHFMLCTFSTTPHAQTTAATTLLGVSLRVPQGPSGSLTATWLLWERQGEGSVEPTPNPPVPNLPHYPSQLSSCDLIAVRRACYLVTNQPAIVTAQLISGVLWFNLFVLFSSE